MRMRLGAFLKEQRETAGMTQLDVAVLLDYGYPNMVSQIERGVSALPPHDLKVWAETLRMEPAALAKKWLYFVEPDIFASLYGSDPYTLEQLSRPEKTIKAAPGRPPLRQSKTVELASAVA
jgi:transcriptional regulator with XRE-family HTH domain